MDRLPIDGALDELTGALGQHRRAVLLADPGAGKTTRVPPALLRSGLLAPAHPRLILLQPRRVAARAAAARIAEENGWSVGEEVGYLIRGERRVGPRTRLVVATEGVLNRQLLADPFLDGVGGVILDEFHERSVHTDLAIAFLREIVTTVRDDLIVLVMSATLDPAPIARFLGDVPVLRVPGRPFPVAISYAEPSAAPLADRVAGAIRTAVETEETGDVLVFLPGAEEIRRSARRLGELGGGADALVLPLHGSLPAEEQDRALRPNARRKIILATNVAETSLTIDGVATVIDSGLARVAGFDHGLGLDRLVLARISKASAAQRAGRAGRTGPGRCIRLWTPRDERGMADAEAPEIARVDLASAVLSVLAWGGDPRAFAWYDRPPDSAIDGAIRLLEMLGAVDAGRITPLGHDLMRLPVHPRLGRLLLAGADRGCARAAAGIAAILEEKDLRPRGPLLAGGPPIRPAQTRGLSDVLDRLDRLDEAERRRFGESARGLGIDLITARRVCRTRDDLVRQMRRFQRGPDIEPGEEDLLRLLLLAYPDRVARRRAPGQPTGRMVGGRGVRVDAGSVVVEPEFFLAIDARENPHGTVLESLVQMASGIQPQWLEEEFPGMVRRERSIEYDEERGRAVAFDRTVYRDLTLREETHGAVTPEEARHGLIAGLRPIARTFVREDEAAAAWLDRLACLKLWLPEQEWPAMDDEDLVAVIEASSVGVTGREQLRKVGLVPFLKGQLGHQLARLMDAEAPEALAVPTGNRIRLQYEVGRPPILAVRLQELFGLAETPRVARGRIPVLLHLLGPNYRPVQVTDDLRSFWNSTYFQVRKDLRARYPKHSWPEDPWNARPEARGGRRPGG